MALAIALVGCGGAGHADHASSSGTSTPPTSGDAGAASLSADDGSTSLFGGDATLEAGPVGSLGIAPTSPVVTAVAGQPMPTVQFTASVGATPVAATWAIDRGELGSVDPNGLFTAAGSVGGVGNVFATYGGFQVKTTLTVVVQATDQGDPAWSGRPAQPGAGGYGGVGGDGPGAPPSASQMAALATAPTADAAVHWLYPYDGTVWPRGLLAPLLQWDSATHAFDSVYVHLQEKGYEFKGYFATNANKFTNVPIPQAAWDTATQSNAGEPLQVTLVFGQGSTAFGPYTEAWTIAPATLQGAIYYNSYGTSLVKNSDTVDHYGNQYGAATLAIAARATAPTLVAGVTSANPKGNGTGCRVCHTVAADGKSLVTQASNISASDYTDTVRIDLTNDTTGGAGTSLATKSLAFPAIFPNGSLLFSSSGGMIDGDSTSRLLALPGGTSVSGVTGLPQGLQAALPAFSPDGKHVAFNFWSGSFGSTSKGDQISLGVVDFDGTSVFSNPRVVYAPPAKAGSQPAVTFSSFLPTGTGVVFDLELANASNEWGFTRNGNTSELWWVDVATQQAHRLDRLNGNDVNGNPALPDNASGAATHTAAQDVTLNYEPTVCPIGAGGYAWVVFTSRRMYGTVAQLGPWVSDPRKYPWLDQITDKKLWVAAIDLNAPPGTDPSHPAFYLPAQELHAGNSRGFWSFGSCKPDLQNCETGAECCGGYCEMGDGGLACTSNPPACAAVLERCAKDSDCCGAQGNSTGVACINSICTQSQPIR